MSAESMKNQIGLMIDIQTKLQEGKGYENGAKKFNLKQLAGSIAYYTMPKNLCATPDCRQRKRLKY